MNSAFEDMLRDTLPMLVELARDAHAKTAKQHEGTTDFEIGQAYGLYEAVSLLISQAKTFGIQLSAVGLSDDFQPDAELLSKRDNKNKAALPTVE